MKPLEKFRKDQLGTVRVMYDFLSSQNMLTLLVYIFLCLLYPHDKNNQLITYQLYCKHSIDSFVPKINLDFVLPIFLHKAERKKYEKETEKYYSSLEKLLNMSAKKKEPQLQEVLIPA